MQVALGLLQPLPVRTDFVKRSSPFKICVYAVVPLIPILMLLCLCAKHCLLTLTSVFACFSIFPDLCFHASNVSSKYIGTKLLNCVVIFDEEEAEK